MQPYSESAGVSLYHGDCRDVLPTLEPVDAILTDPPYGLGFMGKDWDHAVPGVEFWQAALAAAKPGAHMLAFGGSRTFHRLTCAIEDAGWEIRDCLMYVYGSGFPKSLDVSKALDKAAGAEREVVGKYVVPLDSDAGNRGKVIRSVTAESMLGIYAGRNGTDITAPATDLARQWQGFGTSLKPAYEPILLCRKPLDGTVAQNVTRYGTGALNIDASRVEGEKPHRETAKVQANDWNGGGAWKSSGFGSGVSSVGRWPANVLHDGSDEVTALFPQSEVSGSAKNGRPSKAKPTGMFGAWAQGRLHNDSGSAARFFYAAKASASERGEGNDHPCVKPLALLRYLLTLIVPPGGVVLDPFMGSGSTLVAAQQLGIRAIGIEIDAHACDIARTRLEQGQARLPLETTCSA